MLYSHLQRHNDKDAGRKTHDKDAGRLLYKYFTSHFIARFEKGYSKFACKRMLETEHKLHILTPLLWPSRCVFIVLLMFNQRPWGPLHRGFSRTPSVGCGFPYHIWSLLSGSLLATASGVFRVPPRSGVAFPTTSGLYYLEVCWQLHRGFPSAPLVGCGLPYHISSLTLWESAGNCFGTQTQLS